jgi:hypothetical protein
MAFFLPYRSFFCVSLALSCVTAVYANENKYIKDVLLKYNYGIIEMTKDGNTHLKEKPKDDKTATH